MLVLGDSPAFPSLAKALPQLRGRVVSTEGAGTLGNTIFYLLHYPMLGVMTAIDTLLATTFGAGHTRAYGDWTVASTVVVTVLTIPVTLFL